MFLLLAFLPPVEYHYKALFGSLLSATHVGFYSSLFIKGKGSPVPHVSQWWSIHISFQICTSHILFLFHRSKIITAIVIALSIKLMMEIR